jgi:cell pole-organizing protein PopZ
MTPKSDHEEDMSMEEILASIRKFVTDNPPEDPNKQKVYKGDLAESVVIPPAGHTAKHDSQEARVQEPVVPNSPVLSPSAGRGTNEPAINPQAYAPMPGNEPDILELNSPLPSPVSQNRSMPDYHAPWTPPSRTPHQKKHLEESIMTLTNPIETKKVEKPTRSPLKTSYLADLQENLGPSHSPTQSPSASSLFRSDLDDSLGSSQAMAASASSLSRLAQASKFVPKRPPSLADQRNVTLDQLIQDLIRPMIKQWIDTHLPSLVEEMVAKEIKRITKHLG